MKKEHPNKAERKTDRILVLKVKDGVKAKDSMGNIDPRLFNGENKLHAIKNLKNSLWFFKYEKGGLPEPLKQTFTTFDKLIHHANQYFARRNIEISEILD